MAIKFEHNGVVFCCDSAKEVQDLLAWPIYPSQPIVRGVGSVGDLRRAIVAILKANGGSMRARTIYTELLRTDADTVKKYINAQYKCSLVTLITIALAQMCGGRFMNVDGRIDRVSVGLYCWRGAESTVGEARKDGTLAGGV